MGPDLILGKAGSFALKASPMKVYCVYSTDPCISQSSFIWYCAELSVSCFPLDGVRQAGVNKLLCLSKLVGWVWLD